MHHATPLADVREAAAMAGAETFEVAGDGNPRACFRNGWGAARFLIELARKDARRDWVRAFALWLQKEANGDPELFARKLHAYGQSLPFTREEGEIFQGPAMTATQGGDCDCHARLIYAVAKAGGLPTELAFMHKGDNPTHVYTRVFVGGRWRPMETTVAARFGEDPFNAARRLGVVREDIGSPETITMGESDNGECTDVAIEALDEELQEELVAATDPDGETIGALRPVVLTRDLSDGFFVKLKEMCGRLGCSPLDMLAVMMRESGVSATAHNKDNTADEGDDAWGLNQIMSFHFKQNPNALGWPPSRPAHDFITLTAEEQLPFVEAYFRPFRGKLGNVGAIYAVNFLPGRVQQRGGSPETILTSRGESFYDHNAGLDVNRDGNITIDDLSNAARSVAHGARWDEIVARVGGGTFGSPPSSGRGAVVAAFIAAAGLGALARFLT